MAGRKIVDEADAHACLAAVAASGGTLRDWAQAHRVDGRSLRAWQLKLTRRGGGRPAAVAPRPPLRLVELVTTAPAQAPARYLVRVGRVEVELGDGFSEDSLRRILAVVGAC